MRSIKGRFEQSHEGVRQQVMRIDSTNKMFQAEGTVSAKLENAAIIQVKNFSSLGLISWV